MPTQSAMLLTLGADTVSRGADALLVLGADAVCRGADALLEDVGGNRL
jgi:hypothetical protein